MLNWLLYTMLIGGLLTLAAHCVGRVCQLFTRPTRWVWVSALTLTVALAGVAPYRAMVLSRAQSTQRAAIPTDSDVRQQAPSSTGRLLESVQFVRREMTTPTITMPAQHVPVSLDADLAVAWGTLSAVILLFFATGYLRFRQARHDWPISDLHGVRVRIAPDGGPVVFGLRHPEIVIPQWLLGRSTEEQQMVLTHEQEHLRAGDPWVLAVACIIVALLPWHPLVWWMVSRLRLAIELDCDTRVLHRGVAPQTYGSLLIDLAGRCSGLPVRALALADNRSHLKQRLLAMRSFRPRFAALQGLFFSSSALFFLMTAGVTRAPARVAQRMAPKAWNHHYMAHIYPSQVDSLFKGAKTPEDSAKRFFWNANSIGEQYSSSYFSDSSAKWEWSELLRSMPATDSAHLNGYDLIHHTSVLVLVDGVRRGGFPVNGRIPFNQLHINYIRGFNVQRGGHWAVVLYGPQAANGVIDVITDGAAQAKLDSEVPMKVDTLSSTQIVVYDKVTIYTVAYFERTTFSDGDCVVKNLKIRDKYQTLTSDTLAREPGYDEPTDNSTYSFLVLDGVPSDSKAFWGRGWAYVESMVFLSAPFAVKKYGIAASRGAIEETSRKGKKCRQ